VEPQSVFFDPKGRRKVLLTRLAFFLVIATLATAIAFVVTLLSVPAMREGSTTRHRGGFVPKPPEMTKVRFSKLKNEKERLAIEIKNGQLAVDSVRNRSPHISAAFYDPSIESALGSFKANAAKITHVVPAWLHLNPDASLDLSDYDLDQNPANRELIATAKLQGVKVIPLLSNAIDGKFTTAPVTVLIQSKPIQQKLAAQLTQWLLVEGFGGLNLDFEDLSDREQHNVIAFLQVLKDAFAPRGLELTADIESSMVTDPTLASSWAASCNWVVLMDYDEHSDDSAPGPISSLEWSLKVLEAGAKAIPKDKLVLGIGNYAYDWPQSNGKGKNRAEALTFQEALTVASDFRDTDKPADVIDFDADSLNSNFEYEDEDDSSQTIKHTVWMLDAASAYNLWLSAKPLNIRGIGLWALGEEDPGVWSFLHSGKSSVPMANLAELTFPYGVDQEGKGEILRVAKRPTPGKRTLTVDSGTGLITDLEYASYPFPYVIQHSGYAEKSLVLTFDDGPDARYTPPILDELKRLNVPATFFVVGGNAETHPDLVKRAYDQGCEIGNHTFTHPDLSLLSNRRATLELNATQRAIQSVTGHSTTLFRPPYNADSEPNTVSEVEPVDLADKIGYVAIGEKIDPQDWNLSVVLPNGQIRPKTAEDIAQDILKSVHENAGRKSDGNMILLHDAGGPRDQTLAALKLFVPQLQSEGYRFVSVSTLLGKSRDAVMPSITPGEQAVIWFDGIVFRGVYFFEAALAFSFLLAIGLGIARVAFVVPLALAERGRKRIHTFDPTFRPRVSALIAAYNEEKVITRTIESVLESDYAIDEIVVVDDGSKDGTSSEVLRVFGSNPKVRLIRKENGGKASALNLAFASCQSDFAFCIDADTVLDPKAVGLLARHFSNPEVAAVAGNVKVGNKINLLTKWQDLEYTTSQNLDRRAYAFLNAITVVPGAIGMWRKDRVLEVGGYETDTLAEDMDLTWRLRIAGHRLENESDAHAFTEAPDSYSPFFKQRFRWAYGTLQCLVKHRRAVGRFGWFGGLALPTMWLFQIVFQSIAPLVDLQILYSLSGWLFVIQDSAGGTEAHQMALAGASTSLTQVLALYTIFFAVEFGSGLLSYRLERESPKPLVWMFLQRFSYRQIMYGVIYKSLIRALGGGREGWGKLDRKGTVGKGPTS
jgi:peptidoglycan-N-acetylglucosamine deacetylase